MTQGTTSRDLGFLREHLPKRVITEATLSRLLHHMSDENSEGFALLTTDRSERNRDENRAMRKQFVGEHLKPMSFVRVRGGYVETQDDGSKVQVEEHSFFVPNISRGQAKQLAQVVTAEPYNQESIIWGEPEGDVFLIKGDGSEMKVGTGVSMNNIGEYWTRIRGKRFQFVESFRLEFVPSCQSEHIAWTVELRYLHDELKADDIADGLVHGE